MKTKLFKQVFRVIFVSFITIFSLFCIYIFTQKNSALFDGLKSEANNIVKAIILERSNAFVFQNISNVLKLFNTHMLQNAKIENIIVSFNEKSYLSVHKDGSSRLETIEPQLLQWQQDYPIAEFLDSKIMNKRVFHYVYPVQAGNKKLWVHVSLNIESYLQSLMNLYIEHGVILILILLVCFITSYILAREISHPILLLNKASKGIINGDLTHRVDIQRDDEIGELSHTFNTMTKSLKQSKNELLTVNKTLEERVERRTLQLNYAIEKLHALNNSLDKKVKVEVEKRKKQERLLMQQSRLSAMGEMISLIAHQWRQPLNSLSLIIQNIQLQYELKNLTHETIIKSVSSSNQFIQKMSTTIDDFSNCFQPELPVNEIRLYDLICATYKLLQPSFEFHSIKVNVEPSELSVFISQNKFSQVLLNILSNAKDAFIENDITDRKISIRTIKVNGEIIIEIDDNAGGIDEEIVHKVFEPYCSTKEEKNGMGLGLYTAKIIIEQNMKGKLYLTALEGGTRFSIVLQH